MELERSHARPVPARDAAAAGFLDEDDFHSAPAIRHEPLRAHDAPVGAAFV